MEKSYIGNTDICQEKTLFRKIGETYIMETMTRGERIQKRLRKLSISSYRLASLMDVKPASVYAWLQSKGPKREKMNQLAQILKCRQEWLEFGTGTEELSEVFVGLDETNLIAKEFPLISWVQAGQWSEIVDNFPPEDIEKWVPFGISRRDIPEGFCLRVRGDSMEPEFAEGDVILVDPLKQPENGQYVVAKLLDSNEATFKKYIYDAGEISLHPLNYPKYQPIHLNGRKAHIVGVVIGKQKMY